MLDIDLLIENITNAITEALSTEDKLKEWNKGVRKMNVKRMDDATLRDNYKTAVTKKLTKVQGYLKDEAKTRGMVLRNPKPAAKKSVNKPAVKTTVKPTAKTQTPSKTTQTAKTVSSRTAKTPSKTSVNKPTAVAKTTASKTTAPVQRPTKEQKTIEFLNGLVVNIKTETAKKVKTDGWIVLNGYTNESKAYEECKNEISKYVKSLIRKSGEDITKFLELFKKDAEPIYKIISPERKNYFYAELDFDSVRRGYDTYDKSLVISYDADGISIKMKYEAASFNSSKKFSENVNTVGLFKSYPRLEEKICESVFKSYVIPYLAFKKQNRMAANAGNSAETLKKYKMDTIPSSYFSWMKENIKAILKTNGEISLRYHDYDGSIEGLYYNTSSGKYWIDVYAQSGNSDTNMEDSLDNLLRLSRGEDYYFRYVDQNAMKYVRDTDDAIYVCRVCNVEALAKNIFETVKEQIEKGNFN